MGNRARSGEKGKLKALKKVLSAQRKEFTRAQAERALTHGADPTDERFTKHKNYHVVDKAARMVVDTISVNSFVRGPGFKPGSAEAIEHERLHTEFQRLNGAQNT